MFKDDQGDGIYEELVKKILFICLLLFTIFISFLTIIAFYLGGFIFVILGIAGIISSISLNFICWTPYKAKVYCIPLIIGLLPLYLILPGKGTHNPNGILEYRTIKESGSQWFSGIPEQELIRMGEKWGYSKKEKTSLIQHGFLADDYDDIHKKSLFQYDASVVLDSWFFDRGHYWYLKSKRNKPPLLIFLHGSGGNFKAYQHWFLPYAQKYNIAMAFPSWGFGMWSKEKLGKRIEDVINDIQKDHRIDREQIYICALSQGSITGIKSVALGSLQLKGFISISGLPQLHDTEVKVLTKIPLYIIHGAQDERIDLNLVRQNVSKLQKLNSNTKYVEYPNDNHTLIKVKTDEVLKDIFEWIQNKAIANTTKDKGRL